MNEHKPRTTERALLDQGAFWLLIVLILGTSACRSSRTSTAKEPFYPFYERFMSDSSFQLKRVHFPLPGQKFTADVEDSTYRWNQEDWMLLSEPALDPTYFTRDLYVSDTLVTDEISGNDSGFYFKMVYRPVKRKWHLVYLVDRDL